MRMFTIPNQSSVAKAFNEFDEAGRMKPSSYYDRIVDVMEELVRFTVLLRPHAAQLVDRYSERKEAGVPIDIATDPSAIATAGARGKRTEEHQSELQSLMRISYAVFCFKQKKKQKTVR